MTQERKTLVERLSDATTGPDTLASNVSNAILREAIAALSAVPGETVVWRWRSNFGRGWMPWALGRAPDDTNATPEAKAYWATHERQEAEAIAATAQHDGWRPIETAPKDGTRILLFTQWAGDEISPEPFSEIQTGEWDEGNSAPGVWYREADWSVEKIGTPTHWMPLPASPLKGGEGNG